MTEIQSLIKKYDLEGYNDQFAKHGLLDQSEFSLKQQEDVEFLLGINRLEDRKKLFMLLEDVKTRESTKGSDEVATNHRSPSLKTKRNKEKFGKMYNKLRDQKKKRNILIKKPIPFMNIPLSQSSQSRVSKKQKVLRKFLCSHEGCRFDSSSPSELRKHMKKCNLKPKERNVSIKNKNDMIDRLRKEVKSIKIVKDRAEQMHKQEVLMMKNSSRKQKVEMNKLRSDVTELMKTIVEKDRKIKDQQITINRLTALVDKLSSIGVKESEVNEPEPTSPQVDPLPRSNSSPSLSKREVSTQKKLKKKKSKKKKKKKKRVKKKITSPSPIKRKVINDEEQEKEREEEKVEVKLFHDKSPSKPKLVVKVEEEAEEEEFTVHTVSTPEAFKSSPLIPDGNTMKKERKQKEVNNIEFEISREITPFVESDDEGDEDSSDDGMMRFGEDPRFAREEQEELKKLRRGLIGKRRKSLPPSPKQYDKFRKYYNNIYDDQESDEESDRHEQSFMKRMNVQPSMMESSRNHDVEEEEKSILRRMIMEEQNQQRNVDISHNMNQFHSGIGRDSFGFLGTPTDYLGPDYFGELREGQKGGPSSLPSQVDPQQQQQQPLSNRPAPHRRYNIQQKTKKWTFVPVKDQTRVRSSNTRLHSAKITSYRGNTEWSGCGKHEFVVKIDRISGVGFGLKIGLEDSKGRSWFLNANGRAIGPNGELPYTRRYFRRGDLVGVHFDLGSGNLGFSINGKHLGTVFRDVEGTVKPVCVLFCSGNIVTLKSSS